MVILISIPVKGFFILILELGKSYNTNSFQRNRQQTIQFRKITKKTHT